MQGAKPNAIDVTDKIAQTEAEQKKPVAKYVPPHRRKQEATSYSVAQPFSLETTASSVPQPFYAEKMAKQKLFVRVVFDEKNLFTQGIKTSTAHDLRFYFKRKEKSAPYPPILHKRELHVLLRFHINEAALKDFTGLVCHQLNEGKIEGTIYLDETNKQKFLQFGTLEFTGVKPWNLSAIRYYMKTKAKPGSDEPDSGLMDAKKIGNFMLVYQDPDDYKANVCVNVHLTKDDYQRTLVQYHQFFIEKMQQQLAHLNNMGGSLLPLLQLNPFALPYQWLDIVNDKTHKLTAQYLPKINPTITTLSIFVFLARGLFRKLNNTLQQSIDTLTPKTEQACPRTQIVTPEQAGPAEQVVIQEQATPPEQAASSGASSSVVVALEQVIVLAAAPDIALTTDITAKVTDLILDLPIIRLRFDNGIENLQKQIAQMKSSRQHVLRDNDQEPPIQEQVVRVLKQLQALDAMIVTVKQLAQPTTPTHDL